jgi:hypothetical protein
MATMNLIGSYTFNGERYGPGVVNVPDDAPFLERLKAHERVAMEDAENQAATALAGLPQGHPYLRIFQQAAPALLQQGDEGERYEVDPETGRRRPVAIASNDAVVNPPSLGSASGRSRGGTGSQTSATSGSGANAGSGSGSASTESGAGGGGSSGAGT